MSSLQSWQSKIQEKRKQTSWRAFVMEICSWYQINFYKNQGKVSRYPETNRVGGLLSSQDFFEGMSQQSVTKEIGNEPTCFESIAEMMREVSLPALWHWGLCENSGFADTCYLAKNCYLSTTVCFDVENIYYSHHVAGNCSQVYNSVFVANNSQNIYESSNIVNSFDIFFCHGLESCSSMWYSYNCIGCHECLGCSNQTNGSYMIENIQYSQEKYGEIKESRLAKKRSLNYQKPESISSVFRSEEINQAIFCSDVYRGRNIIMASREDSGTKSNLYDVMSTGGTIDHAYACMGVSPGDNFYCCVNCAACSHIFYSIFLSNCSYCFGCIGLHNKSYCIFNKQYSKEEWYQKVDEIFGQMEKDGTLGQFFPATMNPFYFNDTAAYLIDPSFTKEEVTAKGYLRRDEAIKVDIPEGMKIVKTSELGNYEGFDSEGNWTINTDILKKVIQDETGNVYRIIPMEYKFLVKHGLPLPRKHRLERMKENFRIS